MPAIVLLFSLLSYILFLGVFVYLVIFVSGGMFTEWVPQIQSLKTIDSGFVMGAIPGVSPAISNSIILVFFGVQHSVMARRSFKNMLTKIVPDAMERSIFVLATSLILCWTYVAWQPMGDPIWQVSGMGAMALSAFYLLGAGLVLWSTFMINHWELFGLSQAWRHFRNHDIPEPVLKEPAMYKVSRHPLYLGILIVFWATPSMSMGHLLFAVIWTGYVFIGIRYEEKDLIATFGHHYEDYMQRVPQILLFGRKK